MRVRYLARIAALILAAASWPGLAVSGSGVLEINQACAAGPGCFAGDTAAFPVQITSPGSYRLSGSLTSLTSNAIQVDADDVTLDLGGFEIAGLGSCTGSGATLNCTFVGNDGVVSSRDNLALRNGSIRGFRIAISVTGASSLSLERLRIFETSQRGIFTSDATRVRIEECAVERNGGILDLPPPSRVGAALILRSVLSENGLESIVAFGPTLSVDNSMDRNGVSGFVCLANPCLLLGNLVRGNGNGLSTGAPAQLFYGDNVITNNPGGSVGGTGAEVQVGTNVCDTDTVCP